MKTELWSVEICGVAGANVRAPVTALLARTKVRFPQVVLVSLRVLPTQACRIGPAELNKQSSRPPYLSCATNLTIQITL